jgi:hypothetical protein
VPRLWLLVSLQLSVKGQFERYLHPLTVEPPSVQAHGTSKLAQPINPAKQKMH